MVSSIACNIIRVHFPLVFFYIQWRIGLHDTLCYRFFSLEDDDGGLRGSIQITFVSLKSLYSVSNSYEFGLAEAGVRCNCDCPGGGNICYTDTNR